MLHSAFFGSRLLTKTFLLSPHRSLSWWTPQRVYFKFKYLVPQIKASIPSDPASMQSTKRIVNEVLPRTPLIASTVWQHYTQGPPGKSWSLKLHLAVSLIKDMIGRMKSITVEDAQAASNRPVPLPDFVLSTPFTIPNDYRVEASKHLVKLLEGLDNQIGWDWKNDWKKRGVGEITGEWMDVEKNRESVLKWDEEAKANQLREHTNGKIILYLHGGAYYLCSTSSHRFITWRVAEKSAARTFAINYRLAPQHPFPAALEDALAAYLYLLKPPPNSSTPPTPANKIVIMGDSAGGGLTLSLLLAIRDAGLPLPAGAVGLSPWVDLTHSMPSIFSNYLTDYLPASGFLHKESDAGRFEGVPMLKESAVVVEGADGGEPGKETVKRIHFYAPNEALKIKYVSPLYDDKEYGGLPPLLLQTGTGERLRDEVIFTAHKAAGYTHSSYSSNTARTPVTLELFSDMPHVFQMFIFNPLASKSVEHIGAFVKDVTNPMTKKDGLEILKVDWKGGVENVGQAERESEWNEKLLSEWQSRLERDIEERIQEADNLGFKVNSDHGKL